LRSGNLRGRIARFDRAQRRDRDQNDDRLFDSHNSHHSHGPAARSNADTEFLLLDNQPGRLLCFETVESD
jgi:hypothetical protein